MNTSASLPAFRHLPFYLVIDAGAGYLYGTLTKVNPLLTMTIFIIRGVAQTLLFKIANAILKAEDVYSQKIFIVTSAAVNMTFLIAMRELNLVGLFFSCLIGFGIVGQLIHRVRYVQDHEKDDQAVVI